MVNEVDRLLTQSVIDNILETQKAIAERPQKSSVYSTVSGTETPYALADMLALRNTIGPATARLDNALKGRENFGYSLANALSSLPQQQGPGSWVSALARGFGAGYSARTNAEIDRAQKAYDAQMKDAATRLAVDKAMGGTTSKTENQSIGYNMMPYSSGDKNKNEKNQTPPRNYDTSVAGLPEKPLEWGEREIQAEGRTDPDTGVRTGAGIVAKKWSDAYNREGRLAMSDNQDSYARTFTQTRLKEVSDAAGGARGIDTMPEVSLKGGPQLSAKNMDSKDFANAVQKQAYSAAEEIIKANKAKGNNVTISVEELANAFINDFNHGIPKEHRVVPLFKIPQQKEPKVVSGFVIEEE